MAPAYLGYLGAVSYHIRLGFGMVGALAAACHAESAAFSAGERPSPSGWTSTDTYASAAHALHAPNRSLASPVESPNQARSSATTCNPAGSAARLAEAPNQACSSAAAHEISIQAEQAAPIDLLRLGQERQEPIVVVLGGDTNLGRDCGKRILADAEHDPFAGTPRLWEGADLRVVNLESVLSDQQGETESPANRYAFTGPPEGANTLAHARVDVVSLANNHAWDYGQDALLATLHHLQEAGVRSVGAGATLEETLRPWSKAVRGLRLALVAGTGTWNQGQLERHAGRRHLAPGDEASMVARVRAAKREHDVVVVSYHGGSEYAAAPGIKPRRVATAVIDAGADAFVAHHPHVPQGVGFIDGKPVLYSLGNLVFRSLPEEPWTDVGLLAELTFSTTARPSVRLCPVLIGEYLPMSMSAPHLRTRVIAIREYLLRLSEALGPVSFAAPDDLGCFTVTPRKPGRAAPTLRAR